MIWVFRSKEFLYFLICGGIAMMVNFVSRFFYNSFLPYGTSCYFSLFNWYGYSFLAFQIFCISL